MDMGGHIIEMYTHRLFSTRIIIIIVANTLDDSTYMFSTDQWPVAIRSIRIVRSGTNSSILHFLFIDI